LVTLTLAFSFWATHSFIYLFFKMMNTIIMKVCLVVCCVLLSYHSTSAKLIKSRRLDVISRSQNHIRDDRCRQFKVLTQNVDHFGFVNKDTYQQRYTLNTDNWESGKPIFFYAGNEGLIKN
jgi:hypothetical protein